MRMEGRCGRLMTPGEPAGWFCADDVDELLPRHALRDKPWGWCFPMRPPRFARTFARDDDEEEEDDADERVFWIFLIGIVWIAAQSR
jgi:hypothetical protein